MSRPDTASTKAGGGSGLSVSNVAFALLGGALAFYGFRKKRGILAKLATSIGLSLVARNLGTSSIANLPVGLAGLLNRMRNSTLTA